MPCCDNGKGWTRGAARWRAAVALNPFPADNSPVRSVNLNHTHYYA